MSKQTEAMKLALDALIEVTGWQWAGPMRVMDEVEDAITALRQAIADEALDRMAENARELGLDYEQGRFDAQVEREWIGLMDEERRSIREWQRIQEELGPVWAPMMLYLYEAIEAKLKEKNNG